jgi:hypothetical protein
MTPARGTAEQILDALARAPRREGPVLLDPRYLDAIERLERSEECRPGIDKTWVLTTLQRARSLLAGARRLR